MEFTTSDIICNGQRISTGLALAIAREAWNYCMNDAEALDEIMELIRDTLEDCTITVDVFGGDAWEERYNDTIGFYGSHLIACHGDFFLVYYYIDTNKEVIFADSLEELERLARLEELEAEEEDFID